MRKVEGGINWCWYITDTKEEGIKWFCELTDKKPTELYGWEVTKMRDGTWGFRIHKGCEIKHYYLVHIWHDFGNAETGPSVYDDVTIMYATDEFSACNLVEGGWELVGRTKYTKGEKPTEIVGITSELMTPEQVELWFTETENEELPFN